MAAAPGLRMPPALPRPDRESALQEQLAAVQLQLAEVHRELYEAAQMQRKLSGPRHLRRGDFEIASELFAVRHVSGDFFSVSEAGSKLTLAIGDIEGKGLSAGMWFTHLLSLMRLNTEREGDPARAVTALNAQLCAIKPGPPLTTLFAAQLDAASGMLVYCNAGHPTPLVVRADGRIEGLHEGGPVLGVVASASYQTGSVALGSGDMLVGYSDGLTECRNAREEEFGIQRLVAEVLASGRGSASSTLFSVVGAVQDFAGSQAREDDFTFMVVHRRQSEAD